MLTSGLETYQSKSTPQALAGRAKVIRAHMGNSERTSSRLACGWWAAVRPPGQLPGITTRCLNPFGVA